MSGTNTRVYLGKIQGLQQTDLEPICREIGQVRDFLYKQTYAFVEYYSEYDAQKALLELDGRSIKGMRIQAQLSKSKGVIDNNAFETHPRIYVGRLPTNTTKDEVMNVFKKFGDVLDVLRKDDYAFIEFKDPNSARNAIKSMNNFSVNGRNLLVEEARPKEVPNNLQHPRLYVGKLGPQIKKNDLVQAFSPYGQIIDILMKDDFAFIEFATTSAAAKAILEMNGNRVCGNKLQVEEAKLKEGQPLISKSQPLADKTNQQMLPLGQSTKVKTRRLSPRRSISRSRSRTPEKQRQKKNLMIR